ncbi:hypothetical protein GPALN_005181 [Globodera pallida]|nr:hypothetical protein GPALN_005181 [Globodera pallida]
MKKCITPTLSLSLTFFFFFPLLVLLNFCSTAVNCVVVEPNARVDCAPKFGEGKSECLARGCIWDDDYDRNHDTVPLCYFPPGTGYGLVGATNEHHFHLTRLQNGTANPYGTDFEHLEFAIKQFGPAVHVSIYAEKRYRPPLPLNLDAQIGTESEQLFVKVHPKKPTPNKMFYFTVERNNGERIWDTSIGGLLFADQFLQIATYLPSDLIYGFGENAHQQLNHDFSKYTTWGMFSRDQAPYPFSPNSANLYGVHPFYLGLESDGKAHGVFILNSNPQEITTGPAPHLVYRTIGGQLDLFFFPGPTPELVVRQYNQLIGRPYLPPYWAFGYQFCRYGYKNLDDLKATIGRIQAAKIPLDVVFVDIDHMERYKDFTVDQQKWGGLGEYVEELQRQGLKFVPIIDPAVQVDYDVFQRAVEANVSFIEWERFDQVPKEVQSLYPMAKETKIMLSVVWPDRHVAFPDFLDPEGRTQKWWSEELKTFHEKLPFDGIWLDMNEPAAFNTNENPSEHTHNLRPLQCPLSGKDSHFDKPPYETINVYQYGDKSALSEKTLCLLGMSMRGKERLYNTHNLFGWSQMAATRKALDELFGKRSQLLTRSTFVSSGHFGTHWTGDNSARWADLRASIIGLIEFNVFGIPHIGADVCGFNLNTNEELCLRWQQLGAFYPFFRNHNSDDAAAQDPTQWQSVANASRVSNLFRYQLLPHLYTLHFLASMHGGTVVRPMFFEFSQDLFTHRMDRQFLWGSDLLVVPVLDPGVDSVRAYFPHGSIWYSISNAHKYAAKISTGGFHTVKAPRTTPLPTFLRAGAIIPTQKAETTVEKSRQNALQLKIALDPQTMSAKGQLFWDDGESLISDFGTYPYYQFLFSFKMEGNATELTIYNAHSPPREKIIPIPALGRVEVLGYPTEPDFSQCSLNESALKIVRRRFFSAFSDGCKFEYNAKKFRLDIECSKGLIALIGTEKGQKWTIKWHNSMAQ